MTLRTLRRGTRVRAVRDAAEQLRVVFQPVRSLQDNVIVGYEALSRFPTGTPADWFAEAHRLGFGLHLEMTAIVQAVALRQPSWGHVSINVSPTTVVAPEFLGLVGRLQEPRRLIVELTEDAAINDDDRFAAALRQLRDAGVRVAVDDAGVAPSSDGILAIGPDIIKLDRSLIAELETDPVRRASVEALVAFAARIGATLVAEGIELEEERAASLALGVLFGQGYLLGRPVHPADTNPPYGTHQ
jgi:EAL domain-containing protein (putative c-di-GMP-specific phosphodiesterase class I)